MRIILDALNGRPPLAMESPLIVGQGEIGTGTTLASVEIAIRGFGRVVYAPHEALIFNICLSTALERWFRAAAPAELRAEPPRIHRPGDGVPFLSPTPRPG